MTVDQLIEGYIGLYRAARARRSIPREIFEAIRSHGVSAESVSRIGNNLYQKFDSLKKARLLRENQREIARARAAPGDWGDPVRVRRAS